MISTHIAFHDLDPRAWRHAQRLLVPPSPSGHTRGRARPGIVLFVRGGKLERALHADGEPLATLDPPWGGAWSLGRIRRAAGAPWAVAVEDDALERITAEFDAKVSPRDDLVAQSLVLARVLRSEVGKGLHLDPDPLEKVPVPPFAALQKTFDALLPDNRSAALFVFDRNEIWTSVIVEKQAGDVVRVTTHAALGVKRPDWRGGAHRELLQAIESRVAKPHLGAFLSLAAWREVVGPSPGALARQVAGRDAIIDPAPPWLLALTGMGAMAGVAQQASKLFSRFVPQAVKDTASAISPFSMLGFDPIAVFIELRKLVGR